MKYQNFTDFLSSLEEKYHNAYNKAVSQENEARLNYDETMLMMLKCTKAEIDGGLQFITSVNENLTGFETRDLYDAVLRSFTQLSAAGHAEGTEVATRWLQGQIMTAQECQKKIASIQRARKR